MSEQSSVRDADTKLYHSLEKVLMANVIEQRRARRWGIFFKTLGLLYLSIIVLLLFGHWSQGEDDGFGDKNQQHTALINITGVISAETQANAQRINASLRRAFRDPQTKAVILEINSGGGSPVQSAYIYDEIKRLRLVHPEIKIYAVISDIGASGAYYIAAAADEIYANKASLVGSIGVTAASFGFVDAIEKLGVERRVYTSGEHKAFLDPFQPMKAPETAFWQTQLKQVHQQFINAVQQGRKDKLMTSPELFSGLIWSGETALDMGLIDGFNSAANLARDLGAPRLKRFTVEASPLDRLLKRLGVSIADQLAVYFGHGISLH